MGYKMEAMGGEAPRMESAPGGLLPHAEAIEAAAAESEDDEESLMSLIAGLQVTDAGAAGEPLGLSVEFQDTLLWVHVSHLL